MNNEQESIKHSPFDFNELVPQAEGPKLEEEEIQPLDSIVFTDEPNLKVFCHDCRKQINKMTSILSSSIIYRCVGCFAKLSPNQQTYQVIKSLNYSVIDVNWKAIHQILFLNFLEKFGFGNWKQIKDQMDFYGAKHTEEQLEVHYYNYYLTNQDFLPVLLSFRQKLLNNDNFFQKRCDQINNNKVSAPNPTSIASLTTAHNPDQYEEIQDFYNNHHAVHRETNFLDNYNVKRNQFQLEYDQDAELILATLQFRDDDSEEQTRIKFDLIEEYNRRLQKRNQVKKFVLQHRLLQQNYQKQMDKGRNELQKQAFEQLKPIARFTSLSEYNHLVQKVAFTKQLKSIIEGLRKFRRTHPSNFKSLDEFISNQPEESRPKKKVHTENSIKTGRKVEEMLQKNFKLSKRDFENLISNLAVNGKKTVYKNVEAVMLERNSD